MSWLWGTEHPSLKRKLAVLAVLAWGPLLVLGYSVDFIVEGPLATLSNPYVYLLLSMALATLWFRWTRYSALLGPTGIASTFLRVMTFMGLVLIAWTSLWLVCSRALPWAVTRVAGTPYTQAADMRPQYSVSGRRKSFIHCNYKLKGGPLVGHFPDFICMGSYRFAEMMKFDGHVVLHGHQSWLGRTVDEVEWVQHPPEPRRWR